MIVNYIVEDAIAKQSHFQKEAAQARLAKTAEEALPKYTNWQKLGLTMVRVGQWIANDTKTKKDAYHF